MIRDAQPFTDPLIDEVRARRQKLWDDCGRDIRKLYERILKVQQEHPDQLIRRPPPQEPIQPPDPRDVCKA